VDVHICKVSIGAKLKSYRKARGMTFAEFGKILGVSPQAVCKWEHGINYPDITLLPVLARMFGCSVDDFFE